MRWSLSLLVMVGCYSESDFIPAKTAAFCDLLLECTDPAVLAFDGITGDSCTGTWGPTFSEEGSGCKFRRKSAKACIDQLQAATCPESGPVVLPEICAGVFHQCPVDVPTVQQDQTGL